MNLSLGEITKRYGELNALKNFCAEFTEGLYGILGPNGAGKTTLVNIIVGLISQNSGSLSLDGVNLVKVKPGYLEKNGYLPQQPGYYQNYTAKELLHYIAVIKGISKYKIISRIDEVISTVNYVVSQKRSDG
ncbi:MAG: ATP-binding cassette domain-containing protein [Coriobacteriia bacterium]|nr:ATP-binding cassette domain-containing protein [Coriobacteriia bacterium]